MFFVSDMKFHIKSHEHDGTFYGVSVSSPVPNSGAESISGACPICNQLMMDTDLLTSHVESHFNPQHSPGSSTIEWLLLIYFLFFKTSFLKTGIWVIF